jgi:hypothetical protein
MTETNANDTIKAVAAILTAVGTALGSVLGLEAGTIAQIVGLLASGATGFVGAYFAIRRLRAGSTATAPTQGELPLA